MVKTTRQKLEDAKAKWKLAKARAGTSKSSPAYFREVAACQVVLDLQDQLWQESKQGV